MDTDATDVMVSNQSSEVGMDATEGEVSMVNLKSYMRTQFCTIGCVWFLAYF